MEGAMSSKPTKAELERSIRDTGGSMTELARRLGCSRQTAYAHVYRNGLDRLVGIRTLTEQEIGPTPTNGTGRAHAPRQSHTVKLPSDLSKWARVRAAQTDTTLSAVTAQALELLRSTVEHDGRPQVDRAGRRS
jgi:transposase-like protein